MTRAGSPFHILAINHSDEVLALIQELLEDEGYRVTTGHAATTNMAAIREVAADLIVIDYMWSSDDNNWATLQEIRLDPATSHIPIVLCTGAVRQVRELEDHLDNMNISVVLKPFDIDALVAEVARALAPANAAGQTDRAEPATTPAD